MISYRELTEHYGFDNLTISKLVATMKDTDHLFLYQNHMMDASCFGRAHLLLVGPGRTADDPQNPPKEIDPDNCGGLPSRREQLVGEIDLEDVKKVLVELGGGVK